mmetsp:Transcript_117799/g.333958  ORF Transcript_117799/g.333958 Transcript_117799/m.333958 type:complete len:539 (+) Transcript_117799:83-1699(+)|eukprot:CAMPEP_0179219486 /NCGR_PEP_ID=MMETSP0797-20121207/5059_1 /TAXON_ID=47934 /ORGANISM="Dinophysis acuminata, Strain DAEP01" /LENGTH=538 /DNA_ID=CAMNT_0020925957 /DNA_START=58 /DNA_END=1674 /DNA_ORIENTATION=+
MMDYHQRLFNLEQEVIMLRNRRMSSLRLLPLAPLDNDPCRVSTQCGTPEKQHSLHPNLSCMSVAPDTSIVSGGGSPGNLSDLASMHADLVRVHRDRMAQDSKSLDQLTKLNGGLVEMQRDLLEAMRKQGEAHVDLMRRHEEVVKNHAALLQAHREVLGSLASGRPSAGLPGAQGVPPPPAPVEVLFKRVMDKWWDAHKENLRTRITDRDYIEGKDDSCMAASIVKFVTRGLSAARWVPRDSERARSVADKEHYIEVYTAKLGNRTDVPRDNLWNIKLRAEKFIEASIASSGPDPTLRNLLEALLADKEALAWSQGGFGPVVYTSKFLGTYANTMLSGSLYEHPKQHWGQSFFSGPRPLECGIFYIDAGVEYPLHYHQELEAYFILGGETRFVWFVENKLVTMDRKQGEWHFNNPNTPHAITTPHGTPHLSVWFREGGPGQAANNKFGPKWVGCVDGLHMVDEHDNAGVPNHVAKDDNKLVGSLGFGRGSVFLKDTHKFLRALTPAQFDYLKHDPSGFTEIDTLLTPEKHDQLVLKAGQ